MDIPFAGICARTRHQPPSLSSLPAQPTRVKREKKRTTHRIHNLNPQPPPKRSNPTLPPQLPHNLLHPPALPRTRLPPTLHQLDRVRHRSRHRAGRDAAQGVPCREGEAAKGGRGVRGRGGFVRVVVGDVARFECFVQHPVHGD